MNSHPQDGFFVFYDLFFILLYARVKIRIDVDTVVVAKEVS